MQVHSTAIIHPDAHLGEGVVVGAGVVIDGPARIGERTVLQAHVIVSGRVTIGVDCVIGYGAVIGGEPQDLAFRPETVSEVRIGDRNRIREYCTIHRGTAEGSATVVGDDCYLMAGAHLAHNVALGRRVILANNALLGGHVVVGDGVFIGGGCVFHQHVKVGRMAITQGLSAFSKNVPPFAMAAERNGVSGLNAVGLKRAGLSTESRANLRAAFRLLYRSGLNTTQALERARRETWSAEAEEFFAFVASCGKRGICDYIPTRERRAPREDSPPDLE